MLTLGLQGIHKWQPSTAHVCWPSDCVPWHAGCRSLAPPTCCCRKLQGSFAPAGLAVIVYLHFQTAFWYLLMHSQMHMPSRADMAARYAARLAAASAAAVSPLAAS